MLYRGARLTQAQEWRERNEGKLNLIEREFLDASIAEHQKLERQQRQRQRLLVGAAVLFAVLFIATSGAAIFGFWQKDEAEKQTRLAVVAERIAKQQLEEAARADRLVAEEELHGGKDADALAYLARASRYVPKSSLPAEAAIPAVLSASIAHSQAAFQGHTNSLNSAVFSPDGWRVLTASKDNTARLWEAESGKLLATFQGHTAAVTSAVFRPDGRWFSLHRMTKPRGSGTLRAASSWPLSKATPKWLIVRSLARMAGGCSPPRGTRPRGSGRLRAARSYAH